MEDFAAKDSLNTKRTRADPSLGSEDGEGKEERSLRMPGIEI